MIPLTAQYAFEPGAAPIPVRRRRDPFWIVLALSVLVHMAALIVLPPLNVQMTPAGDPNAPFAVDLRPRPPAPPGPGSAASPNPSLVPPVAVAPPPPPPPSKPAARATPPAAARIRPKPAPAQPPKPAAPAEPVSPPVLAAVKPVPESAPAPPAEPPAPPSAAPSRERDFASFVESRRRDRGEAFSSTTPWRLEAPQQSAQSDEARRDQIAAANLGVGRAPTFGPRKEGGGLFQITSLHYGRAEFVFFGWNKDIRRNTIQNIEVRKGDAADIRVAVIRRMIAIIREHESGDFLWDSERLGRNVTLSARPADNAGLEDFLWREFFDGPRPG